MTAAVAALLVSSLALTMSPASPPVQALPAPHVIDPKAIAGGSLAGVHPSSAHQKIAAEKQPAGHERNRGTANPRRMRLRSGPYVVRLAPRAGELVITRRGRSDGLALSEMAGSRVTDVLAHVRGAQVSPEQDRGRMTGRLSWGRFVLDLSFRSSILHVRVSVKARVDPPLTPVLPDVQTVRIPSLRPYSEPLTIYAQATPVAGSSVYVADRKIRTSILYFENFTALGPYFNATDSDPTQGSFPYPNASTESTVGVSGSQFGYEPPGAGLAALPLHRWLTILDSYLVLGRVPAGQSEAAQQYLGETDSIVRTVGTAAEPVPPWRAIASREIGDLANGLNWDAVGGHRYLKSYVSDSRVAPELITQLSVLLGLREFRSHWRHSHSAADLMIRRLDGDLSRFYNSSCRTITNSLATGGPSQEESWYHLTNLISLMQLARIGDPDARHELLASIPSLIKVARRVHYVFPMNIQCPTLATSGPPQRDVTGGYAYLMLGLFRMTHRRLYLREARAGIVKLLGYGFALSYELHMTAYGAAAAQILYDRFRYPIYRRIVGIALANFFNSVRLWDCVYGYCAHGRYHTYMGVNPLPWSDYIAMREQYESWLALSSFIDAAGEHPGNTLQPEVDLARRFVAATPKTMVYSLPTRLPRVAEASTPGAYPFVTRNRLDWDIPLEDLREGLSISGTIGQEIYGAGGPLIFAALATSTRGR